jgi:flagellin-like protein
MKTLKLNQKGVSPIIATLLLIVIAVAAAVVTYSFVMGFLTPGGTTTPQGILSVDSYNFDSGTDATLTAYIRNSGQTVTCSAVYVNGQLLPTGNYSSTLTFTANQAVTLIIYDTTSSNSTCWTQGQNTIKIVCTDTTQYSFITTKP